MRRSAMARLGVALCLSLVLQADPSAAAPPRAPELIVESQSAKAADVDLIKGLDRSPLVGLVTFFGLADPGPPVRVVVAGESTEAARAAPDWMGGYANASASLVVLLPGRAPPYPDDNLVQVFHHELAHVLIFRAAGGHSVPRWFNEGVAMLAARPWSLSDESRFALELVIGPKTKVEELDDLFRGERRSVTRAYALSGALIEDLVDVHGTGLPRAVLSRIARGLPFERAFLEVTGRTLAEVDDAFWSRQTLLKRWIPILGSGTVLWFVISVLALLAIRRKRKLDKEQHRRWEAEEALTIAEDAEVVDDDGPGPPPGPPTYH